MKYYDRKNTPLKWNWFLKITLPFLLISSLFHIVSVFQQLFGLKTGNLNDFLASAGYSVNHMGPSILACDFPFSNELSECCYSILCMCWPMEMEGIWTKSSMPAICR